MIIRLGYACISKTLSNLTPSTPYTYTEFMNNYNKNKYLNVINSNLKDLYELIKYNNKNNIHFFRLSSKLIPLATKKDVNVDYYYNFLNWYKDISKEIQKSNMRVDFHPDQFCVLNSTKKEVVKNSIDILTYHYKLLTYLNIKNKILVIHIGSGEFGKKNSITKFINNFNMLPKYIQECIAIENDDKVFNIEDCIEINRILNIPIVLDYHHYICNNTGKNIEEFLPTILKSWKDKTPKMHFSSPKNKTKKDFRSHNDYINSDDFISFIELLKKCRTDIDIMIEAKQKDEALFRLVRELKYKTNYKFIDETSFQINI